MLKISRKKDRFYDSYSNNVMYLSFISKFYRLQRVQEKNTEERFMFVCAAEILRYCVLKKHVDKTIVRKLNLGICTSFLTSYTCIQR